MSTGARIQTILNVQIKDIDIESKTIVLRDFKNNSSYIGYINFDITLNNAQPDNYFVNSCRIPANTRSIQRGLKPILDRLFNQNLDKNDRKNRVVIHTLRHSVASMLASNGTPINIISKILNHADIKQTMRYAKLSPSASADAIQSIFK